MTDQEYIADQSAKCAARLRRQLKRIHSQGYAGFGTIEILLINALIELSSPIDVDTIYGKANQYNHYRLTDKGYALMTEK